MSKQRSLLKQQFDSLVWGKLTDKERAEARKKGREAYEKHCREVFGPDGGKRYEQLIDTLLKHGSNRCTTLLEQ